MKLTFLGGAGEVGRLGLHVEAQGTRLLLDYGMAPGDPPTFPMESPMVDLALLSHAHLDHAGMLPWLAGRYRTPILATEPTQHLAALLCRDARKVARIEGYPQHYTGEDVEAMRSSFETVAPGTHRTHRSVDVEVTDAGHVPGSAMYRVRADGTRLLFTGDLNPRDTRLVTGAHPVDCDVLVTEATYAGRRHPDRREEEQRLVDLVASAVDRGSTAVVPAFASGRTQEVLMVLADAGFEPYVDGMGTTVLRIFQEHPGFLRDAGELEAAADAARMVRGRRDRQRVTAGGEVVVTTSGMLEGGPVLGYLQDVRDDPDACVALTGYQVEGTNGRRLLDEGEVVLGGTPAPVRARVERFHLSSHGDHDDLVGFVDACDPGTVVLCHSDRRATLADDLGGRDVRLPGTGETLEV